MLEVYQEEAGGFICVHNLAIMTISTGVATLALYTRKKEQPCEILKAELMNHNVKLLQISTHFIRCMTHCPKYIGIYDYICTVT